MLPSSVIATVQLKVCYHFLYPSGVSFVITMQPIVLGIFCNSHLLCGAECLFRQGALHGRGSSVYLVTRLR